MSPNLRRMVLTELQKSHLRGSQSLASYFDGLWLKRKLFLILLAVAACWFSHNYFFYLLPLGYILGLIFGRFDQFREAQMIWPVFDEVIDWKRVDELLASLAEDFHERHF